MSVLAELEKQHAKMFFITFYTVELQHSTFRHQSMSSKDLSEGNLMPPQSISLYVLSASPYSITGPCHGQPGKRIQMDPFYRSHMEKL